MAKPERPFPNGQFLDPDVRAAHIRFLDAVCSWERATSREITVAVIPWNDDDPISISTSGKPHSGGEIDDLLAAIGMALRQRSESSGS